MEKKMKIPNLRFPEFKVEWKEKYLGKTCVIKTGNRDTQNRISNGLYPFYVRSNTVERINSFSYDGEAILTSGDGVGVGKNFHYVNGKFDYHQRVYCLQQFEKDYSGSFIYHVFAEKFNKRVMRLSAKNSVDSVRMDMISQMSISFPSLEEQQKIASFLTAVDEKINLLQKKKQGLEQYKKGVMQQLFSQKLRFKKEDGNDYPDWEEKKLGDFILKFIVPMRDKPKDLKGNIPWCRIEDFNGKYISKSKTNQGVTEDVVRDMNLKIYPINTLLVSCSANLGFCAITKKELITNQTFIGLVPNQDKINIDYLYHVMKLSSRRLNVLSSGTTISYLSRNEFENFKIHYPTITEQTKIANFIDTLDSKIELVNTQITNTQEFKKGLLQQMFV